jgi:hypothetical protein
MSIWMPVLSGSNRVYLLTNDDSNTNGTVVAELTETSTTISIPGQMDLVAEAPIEVVMRGLGRGARVGEWTDKNNLVPSMLLHDEEGWMDRQYDEEGDLINEDPRVTESLAAIAKVRAWVEEPA